MVPPFSSREVGSIFIPSQYPRHGSLSAMSCPKTRTACRNCGVNSLTPTLSLLTPPNSKLPRLGSLMACFGVSPKSMTLINEATVSSSCWWRRGDSWDLLPTAKPRPSSLTARR